MIKVGNYFFMILCVLTLHAGHYSVTDMQGKPLSRVTVGVPFEITCTIPQQVDPATLVPESARFKGVQLSQHRVNNSMSIINGKQSSTTSVIWDAIAPQQGECILPAHELVVAGQKILISEYRIACSLDADHTSQARFEIISNETYCGQAVACSIAIAHEKEAQEVSLQLPLGWEQQFEIIRKEVRTISPQQHQTIWHGYLFPAQPGQVVVPAAQASYVLPIRRAFFFGGMSKQTFFTNALSLLVKPLPPCAYPVHTIGRCYGLDASVDETVEVGKTITYTITIRAEEAALLRVVIPECPVPQGCRVYAGTNRYKDGVLTIEYIIHPYAPGNYELVSPVFRYFDPYTQQYHTLSAPVKKIMVTGMAIATDDRDYYQAPPVIEQLTPEPFSVPCYEWYDYTLAPWFIVLNGLLMAIVLFWYYLLPWLARRKVLVMLQLYYYAYHKNARMMRKILVSLCAADCAHVITDQALIKQLQQRGYAQLAEQLTEILLVLDETEYTQARASRSLIAHINSIAWRLYRVSLRILPLIMVGLSMQYMMAEESEVRMVKKLYEDQARTSPWGYLAAQQKIDEITHQVDGEHNWYTYGMAVCHSVPVWGFQLLFLMSLWILLLAHLRHFKAYVRLGACIMIMSSVGMIGYWYERSAYALVQSSESCLYAGPHESYGVLGQAHYLERVMIMAAHDEWIKVKHSRYDGWIKQNDLMMRESIG